MSPRPSGPDWRRLARWFLLGTIAMLIWLLAPTARCSYAAFRDTPLDEAQPHAMPGSTQADDAPPEEPGFFDKLGTAVHACYRRTPILGQEEWKRDLLIGLAAATVLAWAIARFEGRGRPYVS